MKKNFKLQNSVGKSGKAGIKKAKYDEFDLMIQDLMKNEPTLIDMYIKNVIKLGHTKKRALYELKCMGVKI